MFKKIFKTAFKRDKLEVVINQAIAGEITSVQHYLNKNNGVNKLDQQGRTLLMGAAFSGNLDLVQYLVEDAGASLDGEYGQIAISCAMRADHPEVIRYFKYRQLGEKFGHL